MQMSLFLVPWGHRHLTPTTATVWNDTKEKAKMGFKLKKKEEKSREEPWPQLSTRQWLPFIAVCLKTNPKINVKERKTQ